MQKDRGKPDGVELNPWEKVSAQLEALTKAMSEGRTGDRHHLHGTD